MATEVIIPSLGEVVEDVTILSWSKSEGDPVKEGEPLLEVESEKVTLEIEAPVIRGQGGLVETSASGVLVALHDFDREGDLGGFFDLREFFGGEDDDPAFGDSVVLHDVLRGCFVGVCRSAHLGFCLFR